MSVSTAGRKPDPALSGLFPLLRRRLASPAATGLAFVLPALTVYAAFTAYPVVRTFYSSLHRLEPNAAERWVGLTNFAELWRDSTFWKAASNTMVFAGLAPLLDVGLGLLLALLLFARVPLARFLRVAWFTPVLISYVVVGVIWMWIYNYDWGVVNVVLRAIGLGAYAHTWLGDPATALWSIMAVHTWKWAAFNMVVCLAALSALPKDVLEAAELDHCGWWGKLAYIAVPMIWPTLLNLLILSFIGKMKVFDLIWIMTRGGPLWSTETVSTYVYKRAFDWNTFDLGYPSAIAVVWFVAVLTFVAVLSYGLRTRGKLEY